MATGTIKKPFEILELTSGPQSIGSAGYAQFNFTIPTGYTALGSVGYYISGSGNTNSFPIKVTKDSITIANRNGSTVSLTITNWVLAQKG